jgi:hypothetical protein
VAEACTCTYVKPMSNSVSLQQATRSIRAQVMKGSSNVFGIRGRFYFIYTDLFLGLERSMADGQCVHSVKSFDSGSDLSKV